MKKISSPIKGRYKAHLKSPVDVVPNIRQFLENNGGTPTDTVACSMDVFEAAQLIGRIDQRCMELYGSGTVQRKNGDVLPLARQLVSLHFSSLTEEAKRRVASHLPRWSTDSGWEPVIKAVIFERCSRVALRRVGVRA